MKDHIHFPDSATGIWELMLVGAKCTVLITEPTLVSGGIIACQFLPLLTPDLPKETMHFSESDILYLIAVSQQRYQSFFTDNARIRSQDEEKIKLSFEEQRGRIALNEANLRNAEQNFEINKSMKKDIDLQDDWKRPDDK